MAPSSSVSTKPLIEVTGVLSSCETLATKSRRTASSRLRRVTSLSTTTAPTDSVAVAGAQQRAVGLQVAVLGADAHARCRASTGSCPDRVCGHDALQVGVADDLLHGAALGRLRLDAEQARGGGVDGDDALVGVHGEHALDHAREHRLALVALAGERADLLVELVGHVVEALGHGRELLGARHGELVREVAAGQALGALLDLAHLAG